MQDKRVFLRSSANISALYEPKGLFSGPCRSCTVTDISTNGIGIKPLSSESGSMPLESFKPNTALHIMVSGYRLPCRVVYAFEERMGVKFDQADPMQIRMVIQSKE